jgi:hypothetical protein
MPKFCRAILLIEDVDKPIGRIDGTMTQLLKSGCLDGVKGVAIGQFIRGAEEKPGKWSIVDVLRDHLSPLDVPVLGGLPIGHGPHPPRLRLERGQGSIRGHARLRSRPGFTNHSHPLCPVPATGRCLPHHLRG